MVVEKEVSITPSHSGKAGESERGREATLPDMEWRVTFSKPILWHGLWRIVSSSRLQLLLLAVQTPEPAVEILQFLPH
jgi:hypothetical protein